MKNQALALVAALALGAALTISVSVYNDWSQHNDHPRAEAARVGGGSSGYVDEHMVWHAGDRKTVAPGKSSRIEAPSSISISRGMTRKSIESRIGPPDDCFTSFEWAKAGYQGVKTCAYGVTSRYGMTEDSMSKSWVYDADLAVDYDGEKVLDYHRPVLAMRVAVSK